MTAVGEHGMYLSTTQKMKLALARMLLSKVTSSFPSFSLCFPLSLLSSPAPLFPLLSHLSPPFQLTLPKPRVAVFDVDCVIESETDLEFRTRILDVVAKMANTQITVIVVTHNDTLVNLADVVCCVGERRV
jgi:ABC-type transport system involved in cytochrome bd biosynthesis fused ATPase/permease subunit